MSPHIEFRSVTKAYARATDALSQGFSLEVDRGARFLLRGENGSGKTTLIKLAAGFILPDSGHVRVNGIDAHRASRTETGMMLSIQMLYPTLTGRENLAHSATIYGTKHARAAVVAALRRWDLEALADDPVERYSNGQRALLALARATVHSPSLLLLDEPTAYLDTEHTGLLNENLRDYSGTILISSQEATAVLPLISGERLI